MLVAILILGGVDSIMTPLLQPLCSSRKQLSHLISYHSMILFVNLVLWIEFLCFVLARSFIRILFQEMNMGLWVICFCLS